jgi:hypothetical protein
VQVAVNGYSDGRAHCQERKGVVQQNAEKVRRPVLFIWSVRSVWSVSFNWFVWFVLFIWLNQINRINQINKTNQITSQTGLVPDVKAIEVLLWRNGFSAAC